MWTASGKTQAWREWRGKWSQRCYEVMALNVLLDRETEVDAFDGESHPPPRLILLWSAAKWHSTAWLERRGEGPHCKTTLKHALTVLVRLVTASVTGKVCMALVLLCKCTRVVLGVGIRRKPYGTGGLTVPVGLTTALGLYGFGCLRRVGKAQGWAG